MEENESYQQFEVDEKDEEIKVDNLVDDPYTYENVVANPILKPISEADRNIRDLYELIAKDLIDANRDKKAINSVLVGDTFYNSSPFIHRLIRLVGETQGIIKKQGLIIKKYEHMTKEVYSLIKLNYAVKDERGSYVEVKTEIPEGSYKNYLTKLINEETYSQIAKDILEAYERDQVTKKDDIKYKKACSEIYAKADKQKRIDIAKIMRFEL